MEDKLWNPISCELRTKEDLKDLNEMVIYTSFFFDERNEARILPQIEKKMTSKIFATCFTNLSLSLSPLVLFFLRLDLSGLFCMMIHPPPPPPPLFSLLISFLHRRLCIKGVREKKKEEEATSPP